MIKVVTLEVKIRKIVSQVILFWEGQFGNPKNRLKRNKGNGNTSTT